MPTYNYKCKECEHELEVVRSMKDKRLTLCPSCKKEELQQVISTNGVFTFKGGGWFRSGGY